MKSNYFASAKCVLLEKTAFNRAQGKDVDSQVPAGEIITEKYAIDHALHSNLNLSLMSRNITSVTSVPVRVSTDPGRYLCNFVYFNVLFHHPNIPSVFVHVPPENEPLSVNEMSIVLLNMVQLYYSKPASWPKCPCM